MMQEGHVCPVQLESLNETEFLRIALAVEWKRTGQALPGAWDTLKSKQ